MWLLDNREKIVEEETGSWISDVAAAEGTDRLDTDALHAERLARARTIMEEEGLRSLLCLDPTNVRYLTGPVGKIRKNQSKPLCHSDTRRWPFHFGVDP